MMHQRQAVASLPAHHYKRHSHFHRQHQELQHHSPRRYPASLHLHPHPHLHPYAATTQYHDPALASLVYRPLQLPLLQQTTPQHPPLHPSRSADHLRQQTTTHLSRAAASAGPYQHPSYRHYQSSLVSHRARARTRRQHFPQQQRQQERQSAMAEYSGHQTGDEELAELQKLSEQYQPETHGPLVGPRQPSTAITTEYASADPTYKAKTAALPQKYSHYRTVRGDGNCGWRAVAFGYFEALVRHGDSARFSLEEARLRSMNNVMASAGFEPYLFDDFADETFDLLRKVQAALPAGNADEILFETFNDEMIQNYIITHLRTLTAAWMKTHEENYASWLLDQTVEQYCDQSILPVASEIDHVGLVALKDAMLSPAGLSLEVMYLDRSEGNEVTMHRFGPVTGGSHPMGFVRLLYRPGHYDILYKQEDLPAPPTPPPATSPIPTYLQYASESNENVYDLGVSDFMTSIPGMSYANMPQNNWMTSTYDAGTELYGNPVPAQPSTQPTPTPSAPTPHSKVPSQLAYVTATPPTQMHPELTIRTSVSHTPLAHAELPPQLSGGPFRPSVWQLEPDFVQATFQMPLQTSIFRNSHFNTAHFLNPDFQPEQWDPEDEYAAVASNSSKSSGHKGSG